MLKKGLSVVVMCLIALLAVPICTTAQQQQHDTHPIRIPPPQCPPDCGGGNGSFPKIPSGISAGLAESAAQTFASVQNSRMVNGYYTSAQVASVATTFKDVFANMAEAGYTSKISTWIVANAPLMTQNPTSAQLETAYAVYQKSGGEETYAQFENNILNIPLADRQTMYNTVKSYGLEYLHTQVVAALNGYAASVQNIERSGRHVLTVNKDIPWLGIALEYISIASVSMAVLAGAAPLAIAFGAGMAIAGGISLLCGC